MTDRSAVRYLLNTNTNICICICIYIAKGQPLAGRARFEQHTLHDVSLLCGSSAGNLEATSVLSEGEALLGSTLQPLSFAPHAG
jgi:hypothetical protein